MTAVIRSRIRADRVSLTIVPTLRVGMQFVMLCVTRRFFFDYRADAPRRHAVRDALRHMRLTPPGWLAV